MLTVRAISAYVSLYTRGKGDATVIEDSNLVQESSHRLQNEELLQLAPPRRVNLY